MEEGRTAERDREIEQLFDLSTVAVEDDVVRVRRRLITVDKITVGATGVSLTPETYVKYEQVRQSDLSLNINVFKACSTQDQLDGNFPCMPSLRLEMLEREYHEPLRDREKNWALDSQRDVIDEKGKDIVSPRFALDLGKYRPAPSVSRQFWAPEYQTMLREKQLLRKAAILSDTNVIVQVYGVGFTGRIFSEGSSSPKLLIIEVYSIWNCQKYTIVLTVTQLKILLADRLELLGPGKRDELLQTLVGGLYFKYTVAIPPPREGGRLGVSGMVATMKAGAPVAGTGSGDADAEVDESNAGDPVSPESGVVTEEDGTVVQTVTHLEPISMPRGYPQTVEQMIRVPPVRPEDPTNPPPLVTQELMLGTSKMSTGPQLRKKQEVVKRMEVEREAARIRAIWLATDVRKRDRVGIKLVRRFTHFVVVSAYFEPLRPGTVVLRGLMQFEATKMLMYLGLGKIKDMLGVASPCKRWAPDELCQYTQRALQRASLLQVGTGIALTVTESYGVEEQPLKRRVFADVVGDKARRRRPQQSAIFNDMYSMEPFELFLGEEPIELPAPRSRESPRLEPVPEVEEEQETEPVSALEPEPPRSVADADPSIVASITGKAAESTVVEITAAESTAAEGATAQGAAIVGDAVAGSEKVAVVPKAVEPSPKESVSGVGADVADVEIAEKKRRRKHKDKKEKGSKGGKGKGKKWQNKPGTELTAAALEANSKAVGEGRQEQQEQEDGGKRGDMPLRGWTCLALRGGKRHVGRTLGCLLRPVRSILRVNALPGFGKHHSLAFPSTKRALQLSSRGVRLPGGGHVYCTYTLYGVTAGPSLLHRGSAPSWPVFEFDSSESGSVSDACGHSGSESGSHSRPGSERRGRGSGESEQEGGKGCKGDKEDKEDKEDEGGEEGEKREEGLEANEELNETDAKNDTYALTADGLVLELELYFCSPAQFCGAPIAAGSYTLSIFKDDLDKMVPDDRKEDVARALAVFYADFYERASAAQATAVEDTWDWVGRELVRRSRLEVSRAFNPAVQRELDAERMRVEAAEARAAQIEAEAQARAEAEAQRRLEELQRLSEQPDNWDEWDVSAPDPEPLEAEVKADNAVQAEGRESGAEGADGAKVDEADANAKALGDVQERIVLACDRFQYVQTLLYTHHELTLPGSPIHTPDSPADVGEDPPVPPAHTPRALLMSSNIIHSRAMRIRSACTRPDVLLQVHVWQRGAELGFVCFDREKDDVYFAQYPDADMQLSQIKSFRFISPVERATQLLLFVTTYLAYDEVGGVGRVTFAADFGEEEAAIELDDVMEEDDGALEELLNNASSLALSRMKTKK